VYLGGIVGATDANFKLAEPYLKLFCKNYFHFGQLEWVQNQNF
jgi:3-hydroxyisobutyrate dehydrogenase-like beta-hydroxyacid dehydrogenase